MVTTYSSTREIDVAEFRRVLIRWGKDHFRSYPWRLTDDPLRILVAEVMLHRTQASQVEPVYLRFVRLFPDHSALSTATIKCFQELLHPLGLHWRTRLFHTMVAQLLQQHGGRVPFSKAELMSLTGVSDYIASAVRCFAWNQPEALVDTNSVRVAGRLFGQETRDSSRRNSRFRSLIEGLLDPGQPRAYNYSLLDLADSVCSRRRAPNCSACPVAAFCFYATNSQGYP